MKQLLFSRNLPSSCFVKIIKLIYDFVYVINGTNGMLIYRKGNVLLYCDERRGVCLSLIGFLIL